ncbi:MAG: hypothetical protein VYA60_07990 [Pseudomonadota bacterium]|nr:hypothetical protein [Pseudomonadota bacterium]
MPNITTANIKTFQLAALDIINQHNVHESTVLRPIAKNAFIGSGNEEAVDWFISNQSDIFSILQLVSAKLTKQNGSVLTMMSDKINTPEVVEGFGAIHIDRLAQILISPQTYKAEQLDQDVNTVARLAAKLIIEHIYKAAYGK